MKTLKNWVRRRAQALVEEAVAPAVREAVPPVLESVAPRALQQSLPGALEQIVPAFLERTLPEVLRQVASPLQLAFEQSLETAAQSAMRETTSAMQAAAVSVRQALAGAEAESLHRLASTHAQQMDALAQLASAHAERIQLTVGSQLAFTAGHAMLLEQLRSEQRSWRPGMVPALDLPQRVRWMVRKHAGLDPQVRGTEGEEDLLAELRFLWSNSALVRPMLELAAGRRVLYAGQAYYNAWYLSRALRELGWTADVLNWDLNAASQIYYHGQDVQFRDGPEGMLEALRFYVEALYDYDVFHFSNAQGITFGTAIAVQLGQALGAGQEIHLLKALGRKIVYSNNGCLDGASQSGFSRWGPYSVCAICRWRDEPAVCSDARNLEWGHFRNSVADYQCTLGGNRIDFNDDPRVHEVPGFYCVDPEIWRPDLEVPQQFQVARNSDRTLLLYHAVGDREARTLDNGVNIKSSHIYLPLVDKLRQQGWDIALMEPVGVPNLDVRFLQVQADIFLEMLTYGWFGANAREAMALGKPVVCYIRPEWLESVREELPQYAEELPIVSATPETVEEVLLDLMRHPEKRAEIGRRGRAFIQRWHSPQAGARHFDDVYAKLIRGEQILRGAAEAGRPVIGIRRA